MHRINRRLNCIALCGLLLAGCRGAAALPASANRPFMGWTSWDNEALRQPGHGEDWLTASQVIQQSDAMHRLLQKYGYRRINLDSGWASGIDGYGRPAADKRKFPRGIRQVAMIVHHNGQLLGLYWNPGINDEMWKNNPLIARTHIHIRDICVRPRAKANAFGEYKIDYSKPGAQEYVNSIVRQWARWGVDFIKLDGIAPGSDSPGRTIDDRPDIRAWGKAIDAVKRKIWLEISWAINRQYLQDFQPMANGWRVDGDVDLYGPKLTGWEQIRRRFTDVPPWSALAGPGRGWNDLDSLLVGNGSADGLTDDERQTAMTFWSICCAPLYTGDDLTHLDTFGLKLLTNRALIAIDQAGRPAHLLLGGGKLETWYAPEPDGTFTAAVFNLHDKMTVSAVIHRADLGVQGTIKARDLWRNTVVTANGPITTVLKPHACAIYRISLDTSRPKGH